MASRRKQNLTAKEIIHEKFGVKASYRIEQVQVSSQNDCGGLVVPQNGPCLYRCHLQLPEFSLVSNVFKKKEDSEQSAAELALEKLGIQPQDDDDDDDDNITVEEAWDAIVKRIKHIFSDEFLSADHPLGGHLRATLHKNSECFGSVPVSVIATFDAKINSLCKVINPSVDSDPILVMSYIMEAAAKLSDYIVASPPVASLRRKNPYPPAIIEALATHVDSIQVDAVHIQCISGCEEAVEPVTLDISSGQYYLDIIAEKLGVNDGSQVMISRVVGKTSSGYECRVYYAIPKMKSFGNSLEACEESSNEKSRNAKASFVCGQDIHGDAILASVCYTWKSHDLENDDVTLKSFYRICCSMSPNGIYKISRKALIAAQLPLLFTTKSNWRGPFPREILRMFCCQQQLAEPVFTISTAPVESLSDLLRSHKKMTISEHDDRDSGQGYRCEVKILSKSHDLVLDCSLRKFYEKENCAIQNASLKALSWFGMFFGDLDEDHLSPCYTNDDLNIQFKHKNLIKETFPSSRVFELPKIVRKGDLSHTWTSTSWEHRRVQSIANSSLVRICYSVSLKVDPELSRSGENWEELIESSEEIEFEVGHGSMNQHLESVITQMSVGQHVCFSTGLPAEALVLAAASDTVRTRSLLSELGLEYSVLLLGVKGPTEKQMEEAFFKPPLSEQRVEYVLKQIKESSPSKLVDFGCGSGSLLGFLVDYQTTLQTIIGVDISQKGLARAAKMLHPKLNKVTCNLKSTTLYDGSILEFDSRLHDIDIATCLEVIEHMEEEQAYKFGETVLSLFRPKLLIVSTPNYQYNTDLQQQSAPEHPKHKSQSQLAKFRNSDHKFEWTREQFDRWASTLGKLHNYNVEFSGVGGYGNVDPGFASQIAVFRRNPLSEVKDVEKVSQGLLEPYRVIWEWTRGNGDRSMDAEEN